MAPSPLEVAVRATVSGNLRLKKLSKTMDLQRGMGINGRSMLHITTKAGVLKFCRFLVEEAGLDANSALCKTPILVATEADVDEVDIVPVLQYLLARGCDPTAPDNKGYTPLHNTAEFGHHDAVKLLVSNGVPVDPINKLGTPLHLAVAKDHDKVVKILLEHGANAGVDVNFKSPSGRPVLFHAVEDGMHDRHC